MLLADQGTHLCVAIQRRSQLDLLRLLGHGVHKILIDGFLYQDAATSGADFTLIDEHAEKGSVDGGFKICVGEENIRRLAAEFEGNALHGICGLLHDNLSDRSTAGESNLVYVRMLHQRRTAGLAEAGDNVDHSGRQANISQPVRHFQRRKRSLLGRLQHAGTARSQRGSKLPGGHQQRIIPRNNLPRDPDWFLERKAHRVIWNRIYIAENFCG